MFLNINFEKSVLKPLKQKFILKSRFKWKKGRKLWIKEIIKKLKTIYKNG